MSVLSDYTTAVEEQVPGEHPVLADDLTAMKQRAVAKAVEWHSRQRPLVVVEDETADGEKILAVSALADWAAGFSSIEKIEYPVDDDEGAYTELDANEDWQMRQLPAGWAVLFSSAPTSGETVRVHYTARHTCDGSGCTIEAGDETAVQSLAAAFYCRMLAAAHAQDGDPTISADVVRHENRAKNYLALAEKYMAEYYAHVGQPDGKPSAAFGVVDMDGSYQGGGDRLTHPGRYR